MRKDCTKTAFTLAEVLITLAVIGVVAAMSIPSLQAAIDEQQFKVAYKSAFSDISQAFQEAIVKSELIPRIAYQDVNATAGDWAVLKAKMNKTKECSAVDLHQCWAQGDTVNDDNGGYPHAGVSESFVDAQGRSWALYIPQESAFFVDTNGFKKPNQFGKDRWMFRPKTAENIVISIGVPAKITNWFGDQTSTGSNWCNHPPCYYSSWLYK